MRVRLGRWAAAVLLLVITPVLATASAVSTTQVADTVYRADGTVATGSVVISWGAFTTAAGQEIAGGSTSATIAADGSFSVPLAPNAGATPVGTYYTAVYHLNDGSVTREYWVVPVSSAAVTVSVRAKQCVADVGGGADGDEDLCGCGDCGGCGGNPDQWDDAVCEPVGRYADRAFGSLG